MIVPPTYDEFFTEDYTQAIRVPEESVDIYKEKGWPAEFILAFDKPAEDYIINDASTLYAETSEKFCPTLKYVRNFPTANTWQAFYVPFDISYEELAADFDVAKLNNIHQYDDDKDGVFDRWYLEVLYLKEGSTLKANVPYVIRPKTAGEYTFTLNNATLKPARKGVVDCASTAYKYVFTGTFRHRCLTKRMLIMVGNSIWK